jgi:hypothetical protein
MNIQDYPKAAPYTDLWLMQVPVISTAHIREEDDQVLRSACTRTNLVIDLGSEGWLLHQLAGWQLMVQLQLSDEAKRMLKIFEDKGYRWLRLDGDGDEFDDLPRFSW